MALEPDVYNTAEMLERIRAKRRLDLAWVLLAAFLAITIVTWLALRKEPSPRFVFHKMGEVVIVGDSSTGAVSFCLLRDSGAVCSEEDSAFLAMLRRLKTEY